MPKATDFGDAFAFMNPGSVDLAALGLFAPVAPCAEEAGAGAGAGAGTGALARAVPGPKPGGPSRGYLQVNTKQTGNPALAMIRNVPWEYAPGLGPAGPDFAFGPTACALFLSLKYHMLHKAYLRARAGSLRKADWRVRVLLVQVDVEDAEGPLAELASFALAHDLALLLAFTLAEVARYVETLKAYEQKGAEGIQERVEGAFLPRAQEVLTSVRAVNKTDALNLLGHFGSVGGILTASKGELGGPPGMGDTKVKRLWEAFNSPWG
jgi:DNA excision repair protein ERCC-1